MRAKPPPPPFPPPLPLPRQFILRAHAFRFSRGAQRHPAPSSLFPAAIVVSSDIPGFGSPEWEDFINKDSNNFQVWLEAQFKE